MIDIDLLLKGQHYDQLRESYIIFICKNDPFHKGYSTYNFSMKDERDLSIELNDKSHLIVFNASAYQAEQDLEIKAFLEYMVSRQSTSPLTATIDKLVEQIKIKDLFRSEYMAWGLAEQDAERRGYEQGIASGVIKGRNEGLIEGRTEGINIGLEKGAYQNKIETAKMLLNFGDALAKIAQCTGLSLDEVEQIKNTME